MTAQLDFEIGVPVTSASPPVEHKDWAGAWFDILEEMGEYVGMRAGRRAPNTEELAWQFCSHAGYDGLGWFSTLLRKQSPSVDVRIPRLKKTKKPSWLAQVSALLRLMARKPYAAAAWKTADADWRPPADGAKAGTAVAVHALDADRTRRLTELAKQQRVSLNSLLLASLGRACQPELEGGRAYWMTPVNMRGPVALARETANHTSYLQIKTGAGRTSQQVHEQVKAKLDCLEHWGGWLFVNCGRVVRYAGMKWLFRRELARTQGRPWVGAFSNLGSWENCGLWFVCPPVAKTCPLGVGVVICEGCLSMTIDAHPSISGDAAWTRALMDSWIAELGA